MVANYQTLVLKLKKISISFDIKDDDILNDSAQIERAIFSHNKSKQPHSNYNFDIVVEIKKAPLTTTSNTVIIVVMSSFTICTTISCS